MSSLSLFSPPETVAAAVVGGFAFIHLALCRWRQLLIRQKVEDRVTQTKREGG